MSIRHTAPHVPVVFLIALLSSACEDTSRQTRIGSPTTIDPDARFVSASVSVHPAFLDAQASADAVVPAHHLCRAISLVFAPIARRFFFESGANAVRRPLGRRGASMTILPGARTPLRLDAHSQIVRGRFPFVFSLVAWSALRNLDDRRVWLIHSGARPARP